MTYSKKMLSIVDKDNIRRDISLQEAEKLFSIQWIEWKQNDVSILDHVELRDMGELLGWGLFSKSAIRIGTTIGVFTGELKYQKRSDPIRSDHVFLKDAKDDTFQIIDASSSGNITRFLQHLPSNKIFQEILASPSVIEQIATDNIGKKLYRLPNGIFTEIYYAKRNIKPGEILGCCYDPQFWKNQKPALMDKKGKVIETKCYKYLMQGHEKITRKYYPEKKFSSSLFFLGKNIKLKILCALFVLIVAAYKFGILDHFLNFFLKKVTEEKQIKFGAFLI